MTSSFTAFIPSVHFQFSYHSTAAIKHLAEPVNTHLVVWPCPSLASPPAALHPGICFPGETFQWRDPARWNQPGEGSPRTISLRDTVGFALQSLTLLYTLWVLMWHVDMCVCTFHRSFWIAVVVMNGFFSSGSFSKSIKSFSNQHFMSSFWFIK